MSFGLEYLPHRSYEELARIIAEAGRMLGGWQKILKKRLPEERNLLV